MHNEELHNLYFSQHIIRIITSRRIRRADNVACTGGKRNAYRILVRKPEGQTQTTETRYGWDDNIKLDF